MTSSKPAYLSPTREYDVGRLRTAAMDSQQMAREPHRKTVASLVDGINRVYVILVTQVYPAHGTAVQSVLETDENLHVLYVLYCAHRLLSAGKSVTGRDLYTECQDFAQGLPMEFSNVLLQKFPSSEADLAAHATAASGALQDVAGATPVNQVATSPTSTSGSSRPVSVASAPTPSRTPAIDCVDGVTRDGGQANVDVSSAVVRDEPDNVSFSTRSAAPVEPAVINVAKPVELGATASPDILFRVPGQREGGQRKGGDPQADNARRVKECLWAVTHENKILETYKQCIQCKKNPRDITFLPCGHFITCRQCAGPIFTCMLCNRAILATIDTYLS